jgi:hypothetical protein
MKMIREKKLESNSRVRLPIKMFCAQGSQAAFITTSRVTDCYAESWNSAPKEGYWKDFHFQ